MMEFLETCLSFPVNVFSGLLIIAVLYWLVAAFGILDVDSLDIDMDPGGGDLDLDVGDVGGDAGDAGEVGEVGAGGEHGLSGLPSLLFQLGLHGVPMTLILTLIFLVGWLLAYYGFHWGLGVVFDPGPLRYLLGLLLLGFSLAAGVVVTSVLIRPLRPLFKKAEQSTNQSLRGRTVMIRSSQVTDAYGEAVCDNAGASFLLDVRPARPGQTFKRGDTAVLLDYDPVTRIYTIISEDDFKGR